MPKSNNRKHLGVDPFVENETGFSFVTLKLSVSVKPTRNWCNATNATYATYATQEPTPLNFLSKMLTQTVRVSKAKYCRKVQPPV